MLKHVLFCEKEHGGSTFRGSLHQLSRVLSGDLTVFCWRNFIYPLMASVVGMSRSCLMALRQTRNDCSAYVLHLLPVILFVLSRDKWLLLLAIVRHPYGCDMQGRDGQTAVRCPNFGIGRFEILITVSRKNPAFSYIDSANFKNRCKREPCLATQFELGSKFL